MDLVSDHWKFFIQIKPKFEKMKDTFQTSLLFFPPFFFRMWVSFLIVYLWVWIMFIAPNSLSLVSSGVRVAFQLMLNWQMWACDEHGAKTRLTMASRVWSPLDDDLTFRCRREHCCLSTCRYNEMLCWSLSTKWTILGGFADAYTVIFCYFCWKWMAQ